MNVKKQNILKKVNLSNIRMMLRGKTAGGSRLTKQELDILWEMSKFCKLTIWGYNDFTVRIDHRGTGKYGVMRADVAQIFQFCGETVEIERGKQYTKENTVLGTNDRTRRYRSFLRSVGIYNDEIETDSNNHYEFFIKTEDTYYV